MKRWAKRLGIAAAFALVFAACSGARDASIDSPEVAAAPRPSSEAERDLQISGCDSPVDDIEIVCQAYDLIQRNYVDQVSDSELAEAAARGVSDLDGAGNQGDLVCAAPTDEFDATCRLALDEADSATEAAEAMVAGVAKYALDPNSVYLDRDALDLLDEEQDGEIQGIGALVGAEDATTGNRVNAPSSRRPVGWRSSPRSPTAPRLRPACAPATSSSGSTAATSRGGRSTRSPPRFEARPAPRLHWMC